jgi:hypothetical protein
MIRLDDRKRILGHLCKRFLGRERKGVPVQKTSASFHEFVGVAGSVVPSPKPDSRSDSRNRISRTGLLTANPKPMAPKALGYWDLRTVNCQRSTGVDACYAIKGFSRYPRNLRYHQYDHHLGGRESAGSREQ